MSIFSFFLSINKNTDISPCYREMSQHRVYRIIKKELFKTNNILDNKFSGSEILRILLDDLLWNKGVHASHKAPINNYWTTNGDRTRLIKFILNEFPSLSEDMLSLLLHYMIINSPEAMYMEELQEAIVKAKYASSEILVNLIEWIVDSQIKRAYSYFRETSPIGLIFSHSKFPIESLLKYCQSSSEEIRKLACLAPHCPTEGQVVATLMGRS